MQNKLTIRVATPEDATALLAIYAPYVTHTTVTFECEIPTVKDFAARIMHTLTRYPYLVACLDGEPVGYAYAGAFQTRAAYDRSAELSVYVKSGMQGRGIGSMLYDALDKLLWRQHVTNLYSCITYPGEGSVQFHAKRGYTIVASFHKCGYKFDTWLDMVFMEKFLIEHPQDPMPFLPFSVLYSREPATVTTLLDQ